MKLIWIKLYIKDWWYRIFGDEVTHCPFGHLHNAEPWLPIWNPLEKGRVDRWCRKCISEGNSRVRIMRITYKWKLRPSRLVK